MEPESRHLGEESSQQAVEEMGMHGSHPLPHKSADRKELRKYARCSLGPNEKDVSSPHHMGYIDTQLYVWGRDCSQEIVLTRDKNVSQYLPRKFCNWKIFTCLFYSQ
jgi:hypothetical protein